MPRRNVLETPVEDLTEADFIYDWNYAVQAKAPLPRPVELLDESLRDGLQSPSVVDPPIADKLRLVHLMDALGIHCADIGLPGAGPRATADVRAIAREIRDAKLAIKPTCAARTHVADIQPVVDISQELGMEIEVYAFIGSSSIRLYAEQWDIERLVKMSAEAIDFARKHDLPVTYVTEDTTRSQPEVLRTLFHSAIDHGAGGLCLCDTVGHSTPEGVAALVGWTRALLNEAGVEARLDWHGHNDRGLAVINAMWAAQSGVDRIHGTGLGIGERVGNTAIDQLLVNMRLQGWIDNDLSQLVNYAQLISTATHMPAPCNYPMVGGDAFRTGTGVHAAAVIKAQRRGDIFLADRIYSAVPASLIGREQLIEVGPMAGESNVVYWLQRHDVEPAPGLVKAIFNRAKSSDRLLNDEEMWQEINEFRKQE